MNDSLKIVQIRLTAVVGALILTLVMALAGILLVHSEKISKDNIMNLIAANNSQMAINVDNYLGGVKSAASLMFSDEAYYGFDATDDSISDYDRIQARDAVSKRIVDIALLQNYSDFGVVYADDSSVGWISQGTSALFPDGGSYSVFSSCITDRKTNEGWAFGIGGSNDRIWYLKRLNPHAILVVSFYSYELHTIFTIPDELQPMSIRLIDTNSQILYSDSKKDIGQKIGQDSVVHTKSGQGAAGYVGNSIVAVSPCSNGWSLVSTLPLDNIDRQNNSVRLAVFFFVFGLFAVFLMLLIYLGRRLSQPVSTMVETLNTKASQDQLTGLLNKVTYETLVQSSLADKRESGVFVYLLLDIDDFKNVNDTFGHEKGDEVIRLCGRVLDEAAGQSSITGRVGGDEFSAFSYLDEEKEQAERKAAGIADQIQKSFHDSASEITGGRMEFSVSIGIAIAPAEAGADFRKLYISADQALYRVKKAGKGSMAVSMYVKEAGENG